MQNENNNLLHFFANAVLVIILVYAGEQWPGQVKNYYIEYSLWAAGIGISAFALSFPFGFLNDSQAKKAIAFDESAKKWLYYEGQLIKEKVIILPEDVKEIIADSQRMGQCAYVANYLYLIERTFTFTGAAMVAIAPILFVIGVIGG